MSEDGRTLEGVLASASGEALASGALVKEKASMDAGSGTPATLPAASRLGEPAGRDSLSALNAVSPRARRDPEDT